MSSDLAISVENISKCYLMYDRPQDRLKQSIFRKRRYFREFWALRDISFEVKKGETVGIIGRNGSGKSTLLQIIAGTLTPTIGEVKVNGRVSALLELGSGFNPEFTGRENVFLNGAILGITREEMEQRFDEISTFADIGDFIDQPVRIYSSGMFIRLAFAVAINVEPDILIVDEALAVGDARFQQKCMSRIRKMREKGVAIIFVSHDTEAVKRLCNLAYILERGRFIASGQADTIANWYLAFVAANYQIEKMTIPEQNKLAIPNLVKSEDNKNISINKRSTIIDTDFVFFRHGDGSARFKRIQLLDMEGREIEFIRFGSNFHLHCEIEFHTDLEFFIVGFYIRDRLGTDLVGINTYQEKISIPTIHAGDTICVDFSFPLWLRPGIYSISPAIAYDQKKMEYMDWIDNAIVFRIIDNNLERTIFGLTYPDCLEVNIYAT